MKKIIVGKNTIIFMNVMSLIVALFSIIGALTIDVTMLILLLLPLFIFIIIAFLENYKGKILGISL